MAGERNYVMQNDLGENLTTEVSSPAPKRVSVNCKADMNEAIAIHCAGWRKADPGTPVDGAFFDAASMFRFPDEVPNYCTDPVASFALEQKVEAWGCRWHIDGAAAGRHVVSITGMAACCPNSNIHASRFIAMCLCALSASGVEVTLVEGWEDR